MSVLAYNLVLETTTTTLTGTLTLAGAVSGFQSFAAVGDGRPCKYRIQAVDGNGNPTGDWEVGYGIYTASGTTLSRLAVEASSNSGSLVSLSAGTKRVALVSPASEDNATGLFFFGDGSDGDVTVSGGSTLTRDMYYRNLTLTTGAAIVTSGFRIFVSETLDLTGSPAGAISYNGTVGGNAAATVAGSGGVALTSVIVGGSGGGSGGGTGGTGVGPNGLAGTANSAGNNGGAGGKSGNGGNGTSAGGTGQSAAAISSTYSIRKFFDGFAFYRLVGAFPAPILCGEGGSGGAAGGGNGAQSGGGGGGGAAGGGGIYICCRNLKTSGGAAGSVAAKGGNGGNGGNGGAASGTGGGGAGAGGGGGWIYFAYQSKQDVAATNLLDASGGTGGTGGNGGTGGTHVGGTGGDGGSGGRITLVNLCSGVITETTGSAGSAGTAGGTPAGGGGGAGNTLQANL